jgi:curli biogenesis system outer membrane secretion channel CsgG
LLAGIPLVSLGWTGIPAAAQSANPSLCRQFPQDIRCHFSAPSQVGQAPQPTARPRVAVLDFDFSSLSNPYSLPEAARGVSDLLLDRLVRDGTFSVIERSRLDAVLAEQNLGRSGLLDANAAAQVGRILGVDAVILV